MLSCPYHARRRWIDQRRGPAGRPTPWSPGRRLHGTAELIDGEGFLVADTLARPNLHERRIRLPTCTSGFFTSFGMTSTAAGVTAGDVNDNDRATHRGKSNPGS